MTRFWKASVVLPIVALAAVAFAQEFTATVRGEVAQPGSYALQKGERVSALIDKAGGFTDNAWLRGAVFHRRSAKEHQGEELKEIVPKIESMLRAYKEISEQEEKFLATLASLPPAGRVPVHLSLPRLLKGTAEDIELEEGDELFLPAETKTVAVTGAVTAPGTFPFAENKGYKEYIQAAGGYTKEADRDSVYLRKADGMMETLSEPWIRWNGAASRWEITAFRKEPSQVEAGDEIVVLKMPSEPIGKKNLLKIRGLLLEVDRITGVVLELP
jgi:polysaccharide export outer membrane protein